MAGQLLSHRPRIVDARQLLGLFKTRAMYDNSGVASEPKCISDVCSPFSAHRKICDGKSALFRSDLITFFPKALESHRSDSSMSDHPPGTRLVATTFV